MKEETFGSIRFRAGDGFPLSTDTVLLSAFARFPKNARICDLGAGSGALSLQLLSRDSSLQLTGVELLPQAVRSAEENIALNGLEEQFQILDGDLRNIRALLPAGSFTGCISNPPYFPAGSGAVREGEIQATATSEADCSMEELFAAADWLLQWGGKFCLVHRPERLTDLLSTARACRLEPKRIRMACHRPGAAPNLVLLECVKGGKSALQFEPTLYLHDETGAMSAELRAIYRKED